MVRHIADAELNSLRNELTKKDDVLVAEKRGKEDALYQVGPALFTLPNKDVSCLTRLASEGSRQSRDGGEISAGEEQRM
jgi:hypothetical protein